MDKHTESPKMIVLKCPQCGAQLDLDPGKEFAACPYCNAKLLIVKSNEQNNVINYNIQIRDVHIENGRSHIKIDEEDRRKILKAAGLAVAVILAVFLISKLFGLIGSIFNKDDPVTVVSDETVEETEAETAWETDDAVPDDEENIEEEAADPGKDVIDVPEIVPNTLAIDPLSNESGKAETAKFEHFKGSLSQPDEIASYTLTVPNKGEVYAYVTQMKADASVGLEIYDASGNRVRYSSYVRNENGLVFTAEEPGKKYEIRVIQNTEYPDFELVACLPKPVMEIGDLRAIADSIEFSGQVNEYSFTAEESGSYTFQVDEMMAETAVEMGILDRLGNRLAYRSYLTSGNGFNVTLDAGESYTLKVNQNTGVSGYDLVIGRQKKEADISAYTDVTDSIEFNDQKNVYCFTAPADGRYRFELSDINVESRFTLAVYNSLNERLAMRYTGNYSTAGITVDDLKEGEEYRVYVNYDDGFGTYHLTVYRPKDTVFITENSVVNDRMDCVERRNTYSFTAARDENVRFRITELPQDYGINLRVYNDLNEILARDSFCRNGEFVEVEGCKAGEHLTICADQDEGLSEYTLTVEIY